MVGQGPVVDGIGGDLVGPPHQRLLLLAVRLFDPPEKDDREGR